MYLELLLSEEGTSKGVSLQKRCVKICVDLFGRIYGKYGETAWLFTVKKVYGAWSQPRRWEL